MTPLVVELSSDLALEAALSGGKGANLARLVQAGYPVPDGFCVTTAAFALFMAGGDAKALYMRLDELEAGDVERVRTAGAAIRDELGSWPVPLEVTAAVAGVLVHRDPVTAWAVRSSATAEDLPTASFAGQQDTFLNVIGTNALFDTIRGAWVSLFTDRAIAYRLAAGFSHRDVALAVVVQEMVDADSAGILFTADPLTGHRYVTSIDAGPGLGEALVSGRSSADVVRVNRRRRRVLEVRVAGKSLAIRAVSGGGTETQPLSPEESARPTLTDAQAIALSDVGARIEGLFGAPQDVEWALDDAGKVHVLQARPITTLFPLPEPQPADGALHAYVSFGHAQMMTAAMPPLARSVWRTVVPFGRPGPVAENPLLAEAGSRLYLDPTPILAIPEMAARLPRILSVADELTARALGELVRREEFRSRAALARPRATRRGLAAFMAPVVLRSLWLVWIADPDRAVAEVRVWLNARVSDALGGIAAAPAGAERVAAAQAVIASQMLPAVRHVIPYVMGGVLARLVLLRLIPEERADVEAALRGLTGNVTTDMDLAVGDLADLARSDPVAAEAVSSGTALDPARTGNAFRTAWEGFIGAYGDRGPAEIDISSPRWREDPRLLEAVMAGRLGAPPGSHRTHHAGLALEAQAATLRLVEAARHGPLGPLRAWAVRRLVRAARGLLAVREHPKFLLVQVLGAVRSAVTEEAERLVDTGKLAAVQDVWLLRLAELAGGAPFPDAGELAARREALAADRKRRPPRLMTSDGEAPEVAHVHAVPEGALAGASASAGVAEGTARVILDPAATVLQPGEILVAPATDPGWTPLFLNAAGLVLEVGGLMTHGSVVAREYGIPAVVGVLEATSKIRTGDRIVVNGNEGWVMPVAR